MVLNVKLAENPAALPSLWELWPECRRLRVAFTKTDVLN